MSSINSIGIVGAGLIGSGWAARCLARGIDVVAYDPSPEGQSVIRSHLDNAWHALTKLGFDQQNSGELTYVATLEDLCENVDFIQENAPDSLEIKQQLHRQLDQLTAPEVIIASSSSGLLPTQIQTGTLHPERIVIGHPFNPVYILPLVEVVRGKDTSSATAKRAAEFYAQIGMYPLMVKKEVDGYISDRLQEAVWREALHMVADGVASTKDIDDAIVYGPGLRWAIMGVCLTFHLAGGEQGMKHMLEQFGPALQLPWTYLQAPELTDELTARMIAGTDAQADDQSVQDLERLRDNCLIDILDVLSKYDYSAGSTNFRATK